MKKFNLLFGFIKNHRNLGYRYTTFRENSTRKYHTKALKINELDIQLCKSILNSIQINNREDMVLALSCVVMISSFAKRVEEYAEKTKNKDLAKKYHDDLYNMKSKVYDIIEMGIKNDVNFTFYQTTDEKNMSVTYVNFEDLQFSFHHVPQGNWMDYKTGHYIKEFKPCEWKRNYALQNGAKELFEYVLHLKKLSKLSYTNETPLEYVTSVREKSGKKRL